MNDEVTVQADDLRLLIQVVMALGEALDETFEPATPVALALMEVVNSRMPDGTVFDDAVDVINQLEEMLSCKEADND